jgi:hypothetical protein
VEGGCTPSNDAGPGVDPMRYLIARVEPSEQRPYILLIPKRVGIVQHRNDMAWMIYFMGLAHSYACYYYAHT